MRSWATWRRGAALAGLATLLAGPLAAADSRPPELRGVGIEQRLNQPVPLDLPFRNEAGDTVTLGSLMRGKPVILSLVYYQCPMLCTLTLNGLVSALKALPFTVGEEFDVITVSFDARETPELAAQKKATYLESYRRPGAAEGWHFLTGDAASIERLAQAVGFTYTYIPERNEFAHAAGITVLTPAGVLARYFYGVEFSPRDLKFGLMEAAENRIGSPVDALMLFCYRYDPSTGRYSTVVMGVLRGFAVLTVVAIAAFILRAWRRERAGGAAPMGPMAGPRPASQG